MASLRQDPETGIYRIRFRFQGRSYNRSLKTKKLKSASTILGRAEENLQLIERGRLEIPPKADPAKFILSDGKINGKPTCKPVAILNTRIPQALSDELDDAVYRSKKDGSPLCANMSETTFSNFRF